MEKLTNRKAYRIFTLVLTGVILLLAVAIPVYAWISLQNRLAAYAPISSPEALYIGAGHTEIENDRFEDIRYMYFNGMDVNSELNYVDRVFCVYGKSVSGYRLQLAYTTNNQFTYDIYHATESEVASANAVEYTVHDGSDEKYYYSINGEPITGTFLNRTEVDGEVLANDDYHSDTYDAYNRNNVVNYAEPIYWQTTNVETGNARGSFVNYYILRVHTDGKLVNDRETDIICLAARSFSVSH